MCYYMNLVSCEINSRITISNYISSRSESLNKYCIFAYSLTYKHLGNVSLSAPATLNLCSVVSGSKTLDSM